MVTQFQRERERGILKIQDIFTFYYKTYPNT